ncbi:MAG: translocation/assembly module TamB domain-containing protein [Spirochaetes bacterium]|uniref:Translocation/assembly module TamB domain-containing protein n=1 Tax=Candidatus Ornithospirochaeta stercoripullorum TaxID=2840899 RepID=A0A9D9E104_9SPIO|nr:translocation/assembly module TamB domain-containing protein [Candidatus Ornithospirochaeta stercoripullorum]
MKYHSPLSVILISLAVLLVFAGVALFAVFSLGMTSPTLMITERLLSEMESMDSPISFSVESAERSFRGGFTFNDAEIGYNGEMIAHLESVRFHMGIWGMVRYLFTGSGRLDIEIDGGEISVPPLAVPEGGGGEGGESSIPSFLTEHDISLHVHDVSFSAFSFEADSLEFSAYLDWSDYGIRVDISMPELRREDGNSMIVAHDIAMTATCKERLSFSASVSSIEMAGDGYSMHLDSPVMRGETSLSFDDYSARLSFSSLSGSAGDVSFAVGRSSLRADEMGAELVLLSSSLDSGSYHVELGEADFSLSESTFEAALNQINADDGERELADIEFALFEYDIKNSSFSFSVPSLLSSAFLSPDGGFVINASQLLLGGKLGDESDFTFSGNVKAEADGSLLSGTGGIISASMKTRGTEIESADVEITDLHLPGIGESASVFVDYHGGVFSLDASYGEYAEIKGKTSEDGLAVRASYTSLPLSPFLPLVRAYIPVLTAYIQDETAVTGSFSADISKDMTGPVDFSIAFSDIAFNNLSFSLAASGTAMFNEDDVDIENISLITDWVRASYTGRISYRTRLPEGRFALSMTDSGYELFVAELELESEEEYVFSAEIPYFSSSYLRGSVNWSDEDVIGSEATLKMGDYYYPFALTVDFKENLILIENERLHARVLLGENIEGELVMDRFLLPVFREGLAQSYLDGMVEASFSFTEQKLSIDSDGFTLGSIGILPGTPDLTFSITGDNDSLSLHDLSISSDVFSELVGNIEIGYSSPSIAMYLSSSSGEALMLSILRSSDGMFSGLLRAGDFNLGRVGIDGMIGDINLTARAGSWEALSFSGSIRSFSSDMINNPASLLANLYIDRDEIVLSSLSYTTDNLSLRSDSSRYSSSAGLFEADFALSASISRADGPLPVEASANVSVELPAGENLSDAISTAIGSRLVGTRARIDTGKINLGNLMSIDERSLELVYTESGLSISGSLAEGYVQSDGKYSFKVDLQPVALFSVDGGLGDGAIRFTIDSFEISVADLFLTPSISFLSPSLARGEITARQESTGWNLFGYLMADEVSFDVFWMPNERVILHNPYFLVWDSSFTSIVDDCTVLNMQTYERIPGRVGLTINLGRSLSMDEWRVDVYADDDNWIGIRLPLTSSNIDIWGDVIGTLHVGQGSDGVLYLNGDLHARDLTMSIGMEPMPEWMTSEAASSATAATTADLNLLLTENVKFLFPLTGDPILRADLAENQNLRVRVDDKGNLDVSGSLDIRSGEIFYFQKNFYITEGNISFARDPLEASSFNPVLNLRARLRDFDADGNSVDIFLVLRDSTLDNISPTFESSPSKPLSEIMQILGQSILPTSIYGDITVGSMVSLVSASVDILSRIGIISSSREDTLEQSIRSSLSLDTFSLHTNIIENLLLDTVSYASSNIDTELSPMARYLDGTTLYLGKYISPELYLEGMVHLDAENNITENRHTFLADDLNLDIEISLEWNNPLAVFTIFTRPQNVTFYDLFDSFGFGFSKRIVW